jgi:thiamine pyrophosphate-dependent acetolactate synthase large subunit-like protein
MEVVKPLAVNLADVGEEKFALEDDPRAFVTRAGIVIYYTISRNDNLYSHHFSLTDRYGITAHAVGATLVVYIGLLLNIPPDILTVERSEQQVFHASFDLTEAEQAMFVASPLQTPTLAKVRAMLEECREARHTLVVHPI